MSRIPMLSLAVLAIVLIGGVTVSRGATTGPLGILPEPQHVVVGTGTFIVPRSLQIVVPDTERGQWIGRFLAHSMQKEAGVRVAVRKAPSAGAIRLAISPNMNGSSYKLQVTDRGVSISAGTTRGLFWGVQTLRQLMALSRHPGNELSIPEVTISDAPRFRWRGIMLVDGPQRFLSVHALERQISVMSYYKFNVLHLHLSDVGAWHIVLGNYLQGTQAGAPAGDSMARSEQQFYTPVQIQAIVTYARNRNVSIVPEIDMPGHMTAAIRAYPFLACGDNEPLRSAPDGSGPANQAACVGKDSTFRFLETVLDRMSQLFPGKYIHIGTDEVTRWGWNDCANCAALAQQQGVADNEYGLHSYFVRRISQYLARHNRVAIGWDEVLDGGVNPDVVVENWHDEARTAAALRNGNDVIIADGNPLYLSTPLTTLTLRDVYEKSATLFSDPILKEYRKQVLGGEAALWSDQHIDQQLYPRLFAVSEYLWSRRVPAWRPFVAAVVDQEKWLKNQGVNYGHAGVNYRAWIQPNGGGWAISAHPGITGVQVRYTNGDARPTTGSSRLNNELQVKSPGVVSMRAFRDGVAQGSVKKFQFITDLALGQHVTYGIPPDAGYGNNPLQLTNGILGTVDFAGSEWEAWQNDNMDATVDFDHSVSTRSVDVRFLQEPGAGIMLPTWVKVEWSPHGEDWHVIRTVSLQAAQRSRKTLIKTVRVDLPSPVRMRYLRIVAKNYGQRVRGPVHYFAPWIFCDQVIVR